MDLKAISWVGNIYQKFETMCLEMEEAMYEDTVKYVENQVNTVGTNVKRFCSEVMQDVHPQYNIDPVKVAAADLSLNPYAHYEIDKKLKANLKGSARGFSNKLNDDTQVIKGKSKSRGVYKRQSGGIKEIVRASHPAKKSDAICLASGDVIKLSSSAEVRGSFGMAADHVTLTSDLASEKSDNLSSAMSMYESIESELEIVEKFDESHLEETCVLVEEERIHVPHGPVKQKSYKKKLREAFSTKKRLTRKEYEQLGALYGDQQFNLEAEDKVMPALSMNSNTKMLSANDHPESEWEIL
ncbi:uncharacterized protein LOC132037733 isoform X4 [Lycium ferocissimum]|uniref:uncharacterized protein LOC132037733 isoform X4 n=1 Tax=Lycium ferocissimum TaxID=112874 RepID=UPI0028165C93|nr:uncharacterized protein LOC132037733 isoform X4 [Lycium ferocissimum]